MNRKNIAYTIVITAFAVTTFLTPLNAAEPKPLSKSQAVQLLTLMGYQDVEVGAIVHGYAPIFTARAGTQNEATVLGIGRIDGKVTKLECQLFYDADIALQRQLQKKGVWMTQAPPGWSGAFPPVS